MLAFTTIGCERNAQDESVETDGTAITLPEEVTEDSTLYAIVEGKWHVYNEDIDNYLNFFVLQAISAELLPSEEAEDGVYWVDLWREMGINTMILKPYLLYTLGLDLNDVLVDSEEYQQLAADFADEDTLSSLEALMLEKGMQLEDSIPYLGYQRLVILYRNHLLDQFDVTEDMIIEYYETNLQMFDLHEISSTHILVETEEKAKEVEQKIEDGIVFEDLVLEYSICPSATEEVLGSLGYVVRGSLAVEYEDAIFAEGVSEGDILPIVKTEFGYHIIRVDSIFKELISVEEAREGIVSSIEHQYFMDNLNAIKAELSVDIQQP